jgi:hypothetical protein
MSIKLSILLFETFIIWEHALCSTASTFSSSPFPSTPSLFQTPPQICSSATYPFEYEEYPSHPFYAYSNWPRQGVTVTCTHTGSKSKYHIEINYFFQNSDASSKTSIGLSQGLYHACNVFLKLMRIITYTPRLEKFTLIN